MTTLVLLPGLDGTGLLFADFIAALGPDIKTIVVRYPTDQPLAYPELEAIARAHLPVDEDFYLLGESFSGPIAISIAATRPARLRGLVLCCSFARSPRPSLSPLRPLLPLVPVAALPLALLSFFVLGRFASPTLRRGLAESLSQVSPAALRARAGAALSVDVSASLHGFALPLLYLRATEDRVVPASASRTLLALVPGTRIVELPAPHFLLQVQAARAAIALKQFMKSTTGRDIYPVAPLTAAHPTNYPHSESAPSA